MLNIIRHFWTYLCMISLTFAQLKSREIVRFLWFHSGENRLGSFLRETSNLFQRETSNFSIRPALPPPLTPLYFLCVACCRTRRRRGEFESSHPDTGTDQSVACSFSCSKVDQPPHNVILPQKTEPPPI